MLLTNLVCVMLVQLCVIIFFFDSHEFRVIHTMCAVCNESYVFGHVRAHTFFYCQQVRTS